MPIGGLNKRSSLQKNVANFDNIKGDVSDGVNIETYIKAQVGDSLASKWKDRSEKVVSKELPENFIDAISPSATDTNMAELKKYGQEAFGTDGGNQHRKFKKFLHEHLNIIEVDGLTSDSSIKQIHDYFDRYYSVYPDSELTNVYHYIFMTRPDCNLIDTNTGSLYSEIKRNPVLENIYHTRPHVLKNLLRTGSNNDGNMKNPGTHRFMPIITSRCDSLQLPNTELRTASLQQPYTKYTQHYGLHLANTTGIEFNMTFRETADLSIHYLMSAWINYIHDVMKGIYNPKEEYIRENRADYMVSIYDIMCAPDASTILYWEKITGAFPVENDNSTLSFNLHGNPGNQVSIPFVAYRIDPIHPYSLIDFNFNAGFGGTSDSVDMTKCMPSEISAVNSKVVDAANPNPWKAQYQTGYALKNRPFIYWDKTMRVYKLGWESHSGSFDV